jgi:5'-3' exonuclease
MKIRTLLVDSSYLLKRSYNGAKDVQTIKFGFIGGLYSFLTTVRKLIKEHKINKVVLVWDGENGGVDRYMLDHAYKANRETKYWHKKIELTNAEYKREQVKKQSILKNRKRIQAYAEELFLRQIEVETIEADDIIAQYCVNYNNKEEIFIYSNDRDYAQLLDLNITILFSNIDEPVTRHNFYFKFNYNYKNALAMKVICGDTADNIEGIHGVKEDTLLKHFPELEFKEMTVREICRKADEINKERVANKQKPLKALENIVNGVARLKLNYILINLREPFLNEEALEQLEQLDAPLSPEGRNSKNLYNMMLEDDFLSVYNSNFVGYIEPFYTVIMNEKQLLQEYNKK